MPIGNTDVLTALSRVQHPTLGRDLVSLGFVKAPMISGNDVGLTLALPAAAQAVSFAMTAGSIPSVPSTSRESIARAHAVPVTTAATTRARRRTSKRTPAAERLARVPRTASSAKVRIVAHAAPRIT